MGRPVLAQQVACPWTGLTLLLLLRLPPPVRLFALDPFGSWPRATERCPGRFLSSTAARSIRVWCASSPPTVVSGCPSVPCCSHGLPSPELTSHGRPKGSTYSRIPRCFPEKHSPTQPWPRRLVLSLGGAARSLTWSGGATHAAPLACKSRDGSGQRIGLST